MEKTIYQLICENMTDGIIDCNFSLPEESDDQSEISFAPGALDGIIIYHTGRSEPDADQVKKMGRALRTAATGNVEEAEHLFAEWTKENRLIGVVEDMLDYVLKHADRLNPENVFRTAYYMILRSSHIECVKAGLALLELFEVVDENIKEVVRRLAQYDEFTIYAVCSMTRWENGNEEIFETAKKVHGWGRIHAVNYLEPETEEIRHWLLTEGAVNDVMSSYSALTCWKKSEAEKILFETPSLEEYRGIAMLISGLLDEGPVQGISGLDNAEEVRKRFLDIAPSYDLTAEDRELIQDIRQWTESEDGNNE